MAENNQDYEQYASQAEGKLFSSAMFGFNKDEVLEYIESLADDNYQRQELAEHRILELTAELEQLRQEVVSESTGAAFLEEHAGQLQAVQQELAATKQRAQQTEQELAELHAHLENLSQQNAWLQDAYQSAKEEATYLTAQLQDIAAGQWVPPEQVGAEADARLQAYNQDLARQLEDADHDIVLLQQQLQQADNDIALLQQQLQTGGDDTSIAALHQELADADQDILTLQQQLENADKEIESLQQELLDEQTKRESEVAFPQQESAAILAQAQAEANLIRETALAEKEHLQLKLQNNTGGLLYSISALRDEVGTIESSMGTALEDMQSTLSQILTALAHTELDLRTFNLQIDRLPNSSPLVNRRTEKQQTNYLPQSEEEEKENNTIEMSDLADSKAMVFRPTYSTSSTAWAQQPALQDEREDRMRKLSESLVDTLKEILDH